MRSQPSNGRPFLSPGRRNYTYSLDKSYSLWKIKITFFGARPLVETIRAQSVTQATIFAKNRYPTCCKVEAVSECPIAATRWI